MAELSNLQRNVIVRLRLDPSQQKEGYAQARQIQANASAEMLALDAQRQRARGQLEGQYTKEFLRQTQERMQALKQEIASTLGSMRGKSGEEKAALMASFTAQREKLADLKKELDSYEALKQSLSQLNVKFREQAAIRKEGQIAAGGFKATGAMDPWAMWGNQRVLSGFTLGGAAQLVGLTNIGTSLPIILNRVGEKLVQTTLEAGKFGHELDLISQKTGIGMHDLQMFGAIGKMSGMDLNDMVIATRRFSVAITGGGSGENEEGIIGASARGAKILAALGIETKATATTFRSTADVMLDVADVFRQLADGPEKSRIAIELFGRSGLNLIPFLNLGRDGMKQLQEAFAMFMPDMGSAAELYKNLEIAQAKFDISMMALKTNLAEELLPTIIKVIDELSALAGIKAKGGSLINQLIAGRQAGIPGLESVLPDQLKAMGRSNLTPVPGAQSEFDKLIADLKKGPPSVPGVLAGYLDPTVRVDFEQGTIGVHFKNDLKEYRDILVRTQAAVDSLRKQHPGEEITRDMIAIETLTLEGKFKEKKVGDEINVQLQEKRALIAQIFDAGTGVKSLETELDKLRAIGIEARKIREQFGAAVPNLTGVSPEALAKLGQPILKAETDRLRKEAQDISGKLFEPTPTGTPQAFKAGIDEHERLRLLMEYADVQQKILDLTKSQLPVEGDLAKATQLRLTIADKLRTAFETRATAERVTAERAVKEDPDMATRVLSIIENRAVVEKKINELLVERDRIQGKLFKPEVVSLPTPIAEISDKVRNIQAQITVSTDDPRGLLSTGLNDVAERLVKLQARIKVGTDDPEKLLSTGVADVSTRLGNLLAKITVSEDDPRKLLSSGIEEITARLASLRAKVAVETNDPAGVLSNGLSEISARLKNLSANVAIKVEDPAGIFSAGLEKISARLKALSANVKVGTDDPQKLLSTGIDDVSKHLADLRAKIHISLDDPQKLLLTGINEILASLKGVKIKAELDIPKIVGTEGPVHAAAMQPGIKPKEQEQLAGELQKAESELAKLGSEYDAQGTKLDEITKKYKEQIDAAIKLRAENDLLLLNENQRALTVNDQLAAVKQRLSDSDTQLSAALELRAIDNSQAIDERNNIGAREKASEELKKTEESIHGILTERVKLRGEEASLSKAAPIAPTQAAFELTKAQLDVHIITPQVALDKFKEVHNTLQEIIAAQLLKLSLEDQDIDKYNADIELLKQMLALQGKIAEETKKTAQQTPMGMMLGSIKEMEKIIGEFAPGLNKLFSGAAASVAALNTGMQQFRTIGENLQGPGKQATPGTVFEGMRAAFGKDSTAEDKAAGAQAAVSMIAGFVGAIQTISQAKGGISGMFMGALTGAEVGAAFGPIGAAVGAVGGAIYGGITGMKRSAGQAMLKQIHDSFHDIQLAYSAGTTSLADTITQMQALRAKAVADTRGGKKGNQTQMQAEIDALDSQLASLKKQQKAVLDSFRSQIGIFSLPTGAQDVAKEILNIATALKQAADAGATAAEQIKYLNGAMDALKTKTAGGLRTDQMDTLNMMKQQLDLTKQRNDLNDSYSQSVLNIKRSLGLAPALTPAQQAAIQLRDLKKQHDDQLAQIDEQAATLKAQLDGRAELFGWSLKDLNTATARAAILAQQLTIERAITAETIARITATEGMLAQMAAGKIPSLPAGVLPPGFSFPSGTNSTYNIQPGAIVINVPNSTMSADDMAALLQKALGGINRGRMVGLQ